MYREVQYSPQSVQSSGSHSLFFWGFLKSSCWSTIVFRSDCGLLLRTEVQLVVFYIGIDCFWGASCTWLAIIDQLGKEVYSQRIKLFLRSRGQGFGQRWFGGWSYQRCVCFVLGGCRITSSGSFTLLLGVRLKNLFFYLPSMVAFVVAFSVEVINGYY